MKQVEAIKSEAAMAAKQIVEVCGSKNISDTTKVNIVESAFLLFATGIIQRDTDNLKATGRL